MSKFSLAILVLLLVGALSKVYGQKVIIDSLKYKDGFRKLRIFLPESFTENPKNHQVIIMMDAQNLFDAETSYAGEWEVDEAILSLKADQQPIVIGIDHGDELRMEELTPYVNEKYGGGKANDFLKWIIDQVIPYAGRSYNMELDRGNLAIAGSSLGGLFAHYAIMERPDLFSKAGVFSPSFWFSEQIYDRSSQLFLDQKISIYLSGGTEESENLVSEMKRMKTILDANPGVEIELVVIEAAEHNEKQWRSSFPQFLSFLNRK